MLIGDILNERGDMRYDGKMIIDQDKVFSGIKEFSFVFYGSSKDLRSR